MRQAVVAGLVGVAIGAGAVLLVMPAMRPPPAPVVPASSQPPPAPLSANKAASAAAAPPLPPFTAPPASSTPVPPADDPNHAEFVRARTETLMTLAMNNDAQSLKAICADLYSSDKEIRAAAIDAVVQFGDKSVVPRLRALAQQSNDSDEKAHLQQAADTLELPNLSELKPTPRAHH